MRNSSVSKDHKIRLLEEFYNEFGREPRWNEEYKGIKLGQFLNNIRKDNIKISENDRKYLQNLGMRLVTQNKQQLVYRKVILLGKFYGEFGRTPKLQEEYKGIKLGQFLNNIRRGHTKISEDDREYLQSLGIKLVIQNKQLKVHEKVLLLSEFYERFGREPKCNEEYKGIKIGRFLSDIRNGHTKISEDGREYLENLGMRLVDKSKQPPVHEKVLLLSGFYEEFRREPRWNEEYKDIKIGQFLNNIRNGHTKISEKDRKYLEGLGMRLVPKNKKILVREKVLLLGEFYGKFGREPRWNEEYKGIKIGQFLNNIRGENTKISENDKEYLESLGMRLAIQNKQILVHEKVLLLGEFYGKFGREPRWNEEYKDIKIGQFLNNIRKGGTNLSEEDREYLEGFGMRLFVKNRQLSVHEKVILLGEFYSKFKRNPKSSEEYKGEKLKGFLGSIRKGTTKISETDRKYLESLGIRLVIQNKQALVHEKVLLLGEFYSEYVRKPKPSEEYKGIKLGNFLNSICRGSTRISEKDRNYLESLGMRLIIISMKELIHEKILLLSEFYAKFGRVPKVTEEYNGIMLGRFFQNVRRGTTKISETDREYLESLGMRLVVQNKQVLVHEKVLLLGEFYSEYGRRPKPSEEYKGIKLGNFLYSICKGSTRISEKDRKYLENLGIELVIQNKQSQVHEKVLLLSKFYEKFGRIPKLGEEYEGIKLGNFFNNIHSGHTKISEDDRNYLESLGIRLILKNK